MRPTNRLIHQHKNDWEDLASLDPMWAILSDKDKRGRGWNTEEFFKTGESEIGNLMREIEPLRGERAKALDFGCGVGRLTRALLAYYGEAYGTDISETMIHKAKELTPQCHFFVNRSDDLSQFPDKTFDLVYSNIVLQHLPSAAMIRSYISEFFRIATPGGLVIFQVPTNKSLRNIFNVKRSTYHLLKTFGLSSEVIFSRFKLHPMRMTSVPQPQILSTIEESGGQFIKERPDSSAHFAVFYFCRRRI
jgi:ubiquinone/menaquinone biosynthesis C-methylase UbiE